MLYGSKMDSAVVVLPTLQAAFFVLKLVHLFYITF